MNKVSAFLRGFERGLEKVGDYDPDQTIMFNRKTGTTGPVPGRVKYQPGAPSPRPAHPTPAPAPSAGPGFFSRLKSGAMNLVGRGPTSTSALTKRLGTMKLSPSGKMAPWLH